MAEIGDRADHTLKVLQTLLRGGDINGATYGSILLSSSDPRISDEYSRSIRSNAKHSMIYWPGGSPVHGNNLDMTISPQITDEDIAAERIRVRNAILGASIGEAALARIPIRMRYAWTRTRADVADGAALRRAKAVSVTSALPFAVCIISDIINRESGAEYMDLIYPQLVHPEPVLHELRTVVEDTAIPDMLG